MLAKLKSQWHFLKEDRAFLTHPIRTLSRLVFWRLRCWAKREARIPIERTLRMRLRPSWRGNAKMIYVFREDYEADLVWVRERLRPGMICVDGGAALGIWTLTMAARVGAEGKTIAFEPAADLFDQMRENVQANGLSNVTLIRKALSDCHGSLPLYHCHGSEGAYSLAGDEQSAAEEVETIPLIDALEEVGVKRVDFMKLDLEGAEGLVLRQAQHWLDHDPAPVVMYEQHSDAQADLGKDAAEAWSILAEHGYRQYRLDARTLALKPLHAPVRGGNVIALPPNAKAPWI